MLKFRGILAQILCTSPIFAKKLIREGGYKAYSKEEILGHLAQPLTVDDYTKADKVALMLMQPQVETLLEVHQSGKTETKNPPKGKGTIPKEFLAREVPSTREVTSRNMASLSPFLEEGSGTLGGNLARAW